MWGKKAGSEKAETILKLEQVGSHWKDGRSQSARGIACRREGQESKPHFGASRGLQEEKWHLATEWRRLKTEEMRSSVLSMEFIWGPPGPDLWALAVRVS